MKRLILFFAMIALVATTFAQQLNYQAVVRDAKRQLVVNTPVKATLVVNFASGKSYSANTIETTNAHGLLSIDFGDATLLQHDWTEATLSVTLKNADNGSVYVNEETSPVSAVPYALTVNGQSVQRFLDKYNYLDSTKVSALLDGKSVRISQQTAEENKASLQRDSVLSDRIDSLNAGILDMYDTLRAHRQALIDTAKNIRTEMVKADTTLQNNIDTASAKLRAAIAEVQALKQSIKAQMGTIKKTVDSITCFTSTLTDYDGNTYGLLWLGSQCWMRENLKTTHYSDGTSISEGSTTSTTVGYWYYPKGESSKKATYGLLYNWKAVMRDAASSEAKPSGVQGICPKGWHVPSDAEWKQLIDYVGEQSAFQCDGNSSKIAKALASTTGWNNNSTYCTVGKNSVDNNATGYNAVPSGLYNGSYGSLGSYACFWSTTQYDEGVGQAWYRYLSNTGATVTRYYENQHNGFSVRCLLD